MLNPKKHSQTPLKPTVVSTDRLLGLDPTASPENQNVRHTPDGLAAYTGTVLNALAQTAIGIGGSWAGNTTTAEGYTLLNLRAPVGGAALGIYWSRPGGVVTSELVYTNAYTGSPTTTRWTKLNGSASARPFSPARDYVDNELVTYVFEGSSQFFTAKGDLNRTDFPGGVIPAPTTGGEEDENWQLESYGGTSITKAYVDELIADLQAQIDAGGFSLPANQIAALNAATNPSAENAFATLADVSGAAYDDTAILATLGNKIDSSEAYFSFAAWDHPALGYWGPGSTNAANSRRLISHGDATGAFGVGLGRGSDAAAAHSFTQGFSNEARTNSAQATGYFTICTTASGAIGDNTHGQYSGGAGIEGRKVRVEGYAAFNHSQNNASQNAAHGARAAVSAILGGYNADIDPAANGTVLTASDGTKVPASFTLGASTIAFTYKHASPEFVAMKPGGAYYGRSANGTYHALSFSDAGGLLVNGVQVTGSSGGGGATNLDALTDVTITTPTTGQVLKYNGTQWVNDTDATGTGTGSTGGIDFANPTTLSAASTLQADKAYYVTGAGYTLTLPSAAATPGKAIFICIAANATGLFPISGATNLTMYASESINLRSTADGWKKTGGELLAMSARIETSMATQSAIPTQTFHRIPFNTIITAGPPGMVDIAQSRITIRRTGRYVVGAAGILKQTTSGGQYWFFIRCILPNATVKNLSQAFAPTENVEGLAALSMSPTLTLQAGTVVELHSYNGSPSFIRGQYDGNQFYLEVTEIL